MQKIKNGNSGVTLIILIVTIIVLIIIASISIDYGVSILREIENDKIESELSIVQSAIMQQYTVLISKKEDNKIADKISMDTELQDDANRPKDLVGTRLATIDMILNNDFSEYLIDYKNIDTMTYEQYYYFLSESDLETLGINEEIADDNAREYIVNYSTGEVFDIENKTYYTTEYNDESGLVYLEGSNSVIDEKQYNFTDE